MLVLHPGGLIRRNVQVRGVLPGTSATSKLAFSLAKLFIFVLLSRQGIVEVFAIVDVHTCSQFDFLSN